MTQSSTVVDPLTLNAVSKQYAAAFIPTHTKCLHRSAGSSLSVGHGQFVSLVGESGSGKSTVARLALGLERPDAGNVVLSGKDIASLQRSQLRSCRVRAQPVFQDPLASLNPRWVIVKSLSRPLKVQGLCGWSSIGAAVETLLLDVGLPLDVAHRYPYQLSGGQRQRVCLARASLLRHT